MNPLRFERIEITRLLGIRRGEGFTLEELSPGVNLIHGPNGSGKTTTMRAIQELLWPGRTGLDRPTLTADLATGEGRWRMEIEAGHAVCTPAGAAPHAVPSEARDRYRLALHELLQADDVDFARTIIRESQGGYNLEDARQAIASAPPGRSERQEWMQRRAAVQQARQRQEAIDSEAAQLDDLRRRHQAAIEAQSEAETLERALEYRTADEQLAGLQARLAPYPAQLANLRGDERARLDALDRTIRETEQTLAGVQAGIAEAERQLEATKLPTDGVSPQTLIDLRASQQAARELETRLAQLREKRAEAEAREAGARRRLAAALSPAQIEALQTVQIAPLTDFARRAHQVRARAAVLEERRRWLAPRETTGDGPDKPTLQRGVTALTEWLAAPSSSPGSSTARPGWAGAAACVLLALLGLALALAVHPLWALLLPPAAALFLLDRRQPGAPAAAGATPDIRTAYRQSYEATGLALPASWDPAAVHQRLTALLGQVAAMSLDEERMGRRRDLEADEQALARERERLEQERREITAQLGLEPDVTEEWLPAFIETLRAWQEQAAAAGGAGQGIAELERDLAGQLRRLADGLAPYGYPPPTTAEAARACGDDLDRRRELHQRASAQQRDLDRRLREELEPARQRRTAERARLLHDCGLAPEEEANLNAWLRQLPEYNRLRQERSRQETIRDDRRRLLAGRDELLTLDRAALAARRDTARETAARRDELQARIAAIERDIETAKQGYGLTDAIEAEDRARAALEEVREARARSAAAKALCDWLQSTTVDAARPEVFRRARENLLLFTRGALTLELGAPDEPCFLARCGSAPPRPVGTLSAGERVQLLIAVRLAFVERNESVRLPLLLDETLGNSDDARAGAIIEAVAAIARSGRQVFYFTAQHDEVGKWKAQLGDSVPHRVYDLAECRRLAGRPVTPLHIAPVAQDPVPAPGGDDYDTYGMRLKVPALDPHTGRLDGLHLWHLLDDTAALYRLLSLGISTWGQLRALHDHGGTRLLDGLDRHVARAGRVARLIEAAFTAWRIGRGRPVDRTVLQDSGVVSDRFMDRVAELCAAVNGDARALLAGLKDGAVKRWQESSSEGLETYLRDGGYLVDQTPLSPGDLRAMVLASVAEAVSAGAIPVTRVERVLAELQGLP